MNEQVRGAILAAIAALVGWLAVTSVGLLVQVASLQATTTALQDSLTRNSAHDSKVEERLEEELLRLRQIIESYHGRK